MFLLRIKTTKSLFLVLNVCENLFDSYPDYDYVNEQAHLTMWLHTAGDNHLGLRC